MSIEDYEIFRRWWPAVRGEYLRVYFDVGLGTPDLVGVGGAPEYVDMWIRSNQRRADVVAVARDRVDLVELRFNAQPSGVGRLLLYGGLWALDRVFSGPVRLVLVTNRFDSDVEALCKGQGIAYVVS